MMDRQDRAIGWAALLLAAIVAVLVRPILLPLVLGAWFARLVRPWRDRLPMRRTFAAALLTAAMIVAIGVPIGLLYRTIGAGLMGIAEAVASSEGPKGAFVGLVQAQPKKPDPNRLKQLLQEHTDDAQAAAKVGAFLTLGTILFFFFLALSGFALLVDGERLWAWACAHQPLRLAHFERLGAAFTETGRGLLVYVGLTCLTQGILCTVTFLLLGIPRALSLGFVCALFAVLPVVGSPLVWIPVAIGLFLTGATAKGIILLAVGGGVIAVVENVVGPLFARMGRLTLHGALVMLGMFGGALGLGPSGLFLGPLAIRLAREALDCARESRVVGAPDLA